VIWTDEGGADRYRVCSEFDVILLTESNNMTIVESIWEAKRTISPSTLHDVLSKKLAAIEVLAIDSSAELSYIDGDVRKSVAPFIQPRQQHDRGVLSFGIYGIELLNPANAADSIRSVAGANVVSSNLEEVVRAIERCQESENSLLTVEVDTLRTLKIVEKLKNLIKAKIECRNLIHISHNSSHVMLGGKARDKHRVLFQINCCMVPAIRKVNHFTFMNCTFPRFLLTRSHFLFMFG